MKRIISVLLIAAMTFSATGCLSKSKISSQNLVAYAEQRGSVVYSDVDEMNKDVNEHINSNDLDYFADGIVLTTDDVRYILNDGFLYEVSNSLYSKSVKEVTFFIAAENGGNTDNNSIVIVYLSDIIYFI